MFRRVSRALLALVCLSFSNVGHGQILDTTIDPKLPAFDDIGINLRSGNPEHVMASLAIGLKSNPRLTFPVFSSSFVTAGKTPLIATIKEECIRYAEFPTAGCIYQYFHYNFNGEAEKYQASPPYYGRVTDKGSLIVNDVTIMRTDGSVWQFGLAGLSSTELKRLGLEGVVSSITYPDGEVLTYNYVTGHLRSIVSSTGYMLHIQGSFALNTGGQPTKVTLVNLSTDYCAPLAVSCTGLTVAWPSVTFSGWGTQTVTATTNVGGVPRVRTMTRQNIDDGTVGGLFRLRMVNPEGAWLELQRRIHPPYNPVGGSNVWCDERSILEWVKTPDGQWTYTPGYPPHDGSCNSTKVISITSTGPDGVSQAWHGSHDGYFLDGLNRKTSIAFAISQIPGTFSHEIGETIYPENNRANYTYDGRFNRLTAVLTSKPGSSGTIAASASYPETCTVETAKICNKPTYTIDPRGNRTDYTYDAAHGGVLTETLPPDANGVRPQRRYSYQQLSARYKNASGQLVNGMPIWKLASVSFCKTRSSCAGTDDEVVTSYAYNDNLLPTTETVRTGAGTVLSVVTTAYDPAGNVTSIDGPAAGTADTTYYFYNEAREKTGEIGPDPDGTGPLQRLAARATYNRDGKPVRIATGTATGTTAAALSGMTVHQTVDILYDASGRKIRETVTAGGATQGVTQYSYDIRGRLVCTAVRMNPAAFASLPADACAHSPAGTAGPDRIARNEYDAAGQLTRVIKAYGTPLQQAYATYTYSPNGKQTSVTDANGNKAQFTFDGFDRQTHWYLPSRTTPGQVSTTDYEQYGYDANGNRTSLRKRDGRVINYGYDALGRMTLKDLPGTAGDVHYGYDLRGLQTYARLGSASGPGLANVYDSLGRLTSATTTMGGASRTLGYQYDAAGNRTRLTYPDGLYLQYDYDGLNRMTAIRENGATSGTGVLAQIRYDSRGRRSQLIRSNGVVTTYGYDALSRLAGLDHDSAGTGDDLSLGFGYNPASQILNRSISNTAYLWDGAYNVSRTYAVNGLNQYTSSGPLSLSYDASGNLTADGNWTFGYDAENRWIRAVGDRTVDLGYDPAGRLHQLTADGSLTQFLYDGDALVAEYSSAGTLMRRYVHGPGVDEPIVWYEGAGTADRRWLLADHQGSIIGETSAGGAVSKKYSYGPYGEPDAVSGSRFRYTGQILIPEVGLYHYKARAYSPYLGRFLQTDPIGYEDQVNLYAYAHNDPVNSRDSKGTYTCGATMNSNQCASFEKAQAQAILKLKAQLHLMKQLKEALQNKTELTSSQRELQSRLNTYIGAKAGTNPATIETVIKAGESMLSALQGSKPFQSSKTQVKNWYATNHPNRDGMVYPNFFRSSFEQQVQTMVHEAAHEITGVGDAAYADIPDGYGSKNASRIAGYGLRHSMTNADNLAHAFGFERDD